jgi:pantothenate kinase type III
MVTYLVRAITAELEAQPKLILTGGLAAHPWAAAIPGVDAIDPLLTLRGLALLHAELSSRQSVPSA